MRRRDRRRGRRKRRRRIRRTRGGKAKPGKAMGFFPRRIAVGNRDRQEVLGEGKDGWIRREG
jgi:hypothetical protein